MPDVIRNFQRGLKKVTWPQDTLQVPQGYGRMPALDTMNSKVTRREYSTYVGGATGVTLNTPQLINIPIAKDGDFWISSIMGQTIQTFFVPNNIGYVVGRIQITDVMTQYRFFQPDLPWGAICREPNLAADASSLFLSNVIEPYCVQRGSALLVEITLTAAPFPAPWDIQIAFNGWKEYANASI